MIYECFFSGGPCHGNVRSISPGREEVYWRDQEPFNLADCISLMKDCRDRPKTMIHLYRRVDNYTFEYVKSESL